MPRKKRVILKDHFYHVMIRGVGGQDIFFDNEDRVRFCLLLQNASEICNFNIHGFCLMRNHVHLLIQPCKTNLSEGMHRLSFRYAQHINKKTDRQGHLFQGRYKAIMIQDGVYLRRLIRYIHQNPVRANITRHPNHYQWCSHNAYLEKTHFTWLKTNVVLSLFSSEKRIALQTYLNYMSPTDQEADHELIEIRKSLEIGAYGNEDFVEKYSEALTSDCTHSQMMFTHSNVTFDMIANEITHQTRFSLEEIFSSKRTESLVEARALFIKIAIHLNLLTTKELAKMFKKDPTTILRLEQRVKNCTKLQSAAEEILNALLPKENLFRKIINE